MLPQYNRLGGSSGSSIINRKSPFHSKEKCLIALVLATLILLCFGGFFLLPDNFNSDRVLNVYKQIQRAGPDMFIPPPPLAKHQHHNQHNLNSKDIDPHLIVDREKLKAKINEELGDMIERPDFIDDRDNKNKDVSNGGDQQHAPIAEPPSEPNDGMYDMPIIGKEDDEKEKVLKFENNGEDLDSNIRQKRNVVKEMMIHAWDNYKLYAWGKNELKPLSQRPHSGSIFGSYDLGATIIDGLDTLYIMGLTDRFNEGKDWISRRFTLDNISADLSVFETNIRFVGGLLTLYSFTGDPMFKDKAQHVADKLLPAFQTPTGIPYALVNTRSGVSKNYGWASGGSSILSEFGTLHLEFSYLSDITGNPVYRERVQNIRQVLKEIEKPKGLYPNYLNPKTGKWGQLHMSLGALGDSFYEYLLKAWIQSGQQDVEARIMFDEAMHAIAEEMVLTSINGLTYVSDLKFERLEHKMDHLACFAGGLYALGAKTEINKNSKKFMTIGEGITNTCHESYIRTPTKLGPEAFRFTEAIEARSLKSQEKYYILRPEAFESYFILWRLTHQEKYRDWGWEAVQALEKYCKTPHGYCGLKNVYQDEPQKDDVQQSFFLAESLKYLYLLFSDDALLPLDDWVFNTEAHPLPIYGSSLYRMAIGQPSTLP